MRHILIIALTLSLTGCTPTEPANSIVNAELNSPMTETLRTRNALIARILPQYEADNNHNVLPVVTLEEFFTGNIDEMSLAPNIAYETRPPLQECFRILREIRDRPDVQTVLVAIHETPYPDDEADYDIWPDSDTIYILTSASESAVAVWCAPLHPTNLAEGWSCGTGIKPQAAPELDDEMVVRTLWWD